MFIIIIIMLINSIIIIIIVNNLIIILILIIIIIFLFLGIHRRGGQPQTHRRGVFSTMFPRCFDNVLRDRKTSPLKGVTYRKSDSWRNSLISVFWLFSMRRVSVQNEFLDIKTLLRRY